MAHFDKPVFTTILQHAAELRPQPHSLYITGTSVEDRSHHTEDWRSLCQDVKFAQLDSSDRSKTIFSVNQIQETISLRSTTSIAQFLSTERYSAYYLDITGLPHHVWAPLLKGLMCRSEKVFCVYVEPGDYRLSETPTEATIFDLSEKIEGIAPLPGFVSLPAATERDALFVPLLGFEGPRFAYMLENVQPKRDDIVPIIGVPGFRPEYPFYTYVGNRIKLWETHSWKNVRFVAANCPFSLYNLLIDVFDQSKLRRMVIAAIGTKPHALGAVLYYLYYPGTTELLYDHPVRKAQRTQGASRVCVYDLSRFPRIKV